MAGITRKIYNLAVRICIIYLGVLKMVKQRIIIDVHLQNQSSFMQFFIVSFNSFNEKGTELQKI